MAMENKGLSPSPPLPPSLPPSGGSYTRREIEMFWRKKRLVEEDHLLAAIKASARLRATRLSEKDYKQFLVSLEENEVMGEDVNEDYVNNQENRVGVKDWWTKSKYAYLNQPSIGTIRTNRRTNYKPNNLFMCAKPLLLVSTSSFVK